MENHLIIGLGGTGGHIIRAFRKRVYEEFRTNNVPNDDFNTINISYLWVDSSEDDFNDTESWRTMGKSIALDPGDKLLIAETSSSILDEMKREPKRYPGIAPWIGEQKTWDQIKGGITDKAGGQRRRLGRLLFAWNIAEFKEYLNRHINFLVTKSNVQDVTFHICCGLAGGTGSGCIVDVISQIRETIPNVAKIIVYAKLPETATPPPANWIRGVAYYKPNGYAALLELNALSVKAYNPYNIGADKENVKRMLTDRNVEAFDTCYVYANGNKSRRILGVENGQLFQVVSDFLFYKIIGIQRLENKVINFENCIGDAEEDTRSQRFQSFGISRIEYPEQEIREYICYNFEKQAMLQFQFNHWSDLGFSTKPEDEIGMGYAADLRSDRNGVFPQWRIDEEHLTLSQKIIDDNRNTWFTFSDDWNQVNKHKKIAKEKENAEWLTELETLCLKDYKSDFRNVGVQEFFRNQKEEIKGYASHIRGLIERDLFKDWENGDKSIVEVEKYLQTLIDVNENRLEKLGEKQQKKRQELKDKIEPKIKENRDAWAKLGKKTDMFGRLTKALDIHCELLKRKYQTMTEEEGLDYAQQLLRKVNEMLRDLCEIIIALKTTITKSLQKVEISINSRCNRNNDNIFANGVLTVKEYNPDDIQTETKKIMRDDKISKENARKVRAKIIEKISDDFPDFTKMSKKMTGNQVLINTFDEVCNNSAVTVMEKMKEKQVEVNILEKIAAKYGDDEEALGKYIENQLTLADLLIQQNDRENVAYGGIAMRPSYVLFVPEWHDVNKFRDKFISKCKSVSKYQLDDVLNFKKNEIIVISTAEGFPLRYLADVERLRKDYDAKIADINENKHKLLLHTEGDGSQFPSLYTNKWDDDKKEEFSPYLMLALAMGIIKNDFLHDGSGKRGYFINDDKKTSLQHKTYRNVVENITEEEAEKIRKFVENKLNTGEYLSKVKREALKQEIDGNLHKAIEKECGSNKSDWNKFVDAKAPAKEILDRDKKRLTD